MLDFVSNTGGFYEFNAAVDAILPMERAGGSRPQRASPAAGKQRGPLHPEQRRRTPDRIGMGGQSGPAAGPHGLSQSL